MPVRKKVVRYEQAFRSIGMVFTNKAQLIVKMLEKDNRTEGCICFAIWKERSLLEEHVGQKDFWKVFGEVIDKWCWKKDDPRWIEWKKKRLAQEQAKQLQLDLRKANTYQKPSKKGMSGFIYFIQGISGGPIKIGYTTDLENRLKTLQTGYPDRLEYLLAFPGSPEHEKALHKQFAQYRLNGEWFNPDPKVLERIKHFTVLNAYVSAPDVDIMRMNRLY